MNLDKNLKDLCEERSLTLSELARRSGVKQPTLHGWLTGRTVHNLDDLKKVSSVLEVSLHQLLFGSPDPHENVGRELLEEIFQGEVRVSIQRIKR